MVDYRRAKVATLVAKVCIPNLTGMGAHTSFL
jgi:hypothetical protein